MSAQSQRKSILIVDDDINVVQALNRILFKSFKIIAADNGRHALEIMARVAGVAAVMTDLKMPLMDGVQLLAAAKEFHPHVPRILFTGTPDRGQIDDAMRVGVLGVLYKPLDAAEVGQFLTLAVSDHWDRT